MADAGARANKTSTGRQQIGPRITPATKELLERHCEERLMSISDLVEEALARYLAPDDTIVDPARLWQKLTQMDKTLTEIGACVEIIGTLLATEATQPKTPVATYAQMYGAIESAPVTEPSLPVLPPTLEPSRGWFSRWFMRRDDL